MEPGISTPTAWASVARIILFALLTLCLSAPHLGAQSWNSTLEGTVTDQSGAAIPQANVRLTNAGTGQIRKTTTNDQGHFTFSLLPIGRYQLTIAADGFATQTVGNLTLQVGETIHKDVELKLSGKTEVIDLIEPPALVQTDTQALGDEINNLFFA